MKPQTTRIKLTCEKCGCTEHVKEGSAIYCSNPMCCWHPKPKQERSGTPKIYKKRKAKLIPCACGCGELIEKLGRREYKPGHKPNEYQQKKKKLGTKIMQEIRRKRYLQSFSKNKIAA